MSFWSHITGTVQVEIVTASAEQRITQINNAGIVLYSVKRLDELSFRAVIKKRDLQALEKLAERKNEKLNVLCRNGLPWFLKRMSGRPVILLAICACLLLTLILPRYVLFVRIDGNHSVSTEKILEASELCGIGFGAVRRNIRSERVKNRMLEHLPELQWVGVNTNGCVATIAVRERSDAKENNSVSSIHGIVAGRDGVIREITATRGTTLCKVGEAVKKGQLLISSYTDCGLLLRAETAQGEVFADTVHELTAVSPSIFQNRTGKPYVKVKFSILFGKKQINLFKDSGISGAGCVRIYKEHKLMLPGGFQLPVSLLQITDMCYEEETVEAIDPDGFSWVDKYTVDYLKAQMVAGSVYDSDTAGILVGESYLLQGKYACTEMIGRIRNKEFTEEYGKSD